ncbi:MAG: GspE/PulE family protein [Opitutae bacterium]|jgi:general secretion pathway protein E/type IV pilus assembly protein PilB|nr:GspE/PulE family protein [Opitutae bacterium]
MTSDDGFIIELLTKKNAVSETAVQSARQAVEDSFEGPVEEISETLVLEHLVDDLNIPKEQILSALADEFNMEIGHVDEVLLSDDVKEFFPFNLVQKYKFFPLSINDAEAEIAVSDPFNIDTVDNITHILNRPLILRLSSTADIENAINANYDESSDSINAAFASATEALSGDASQTVSIEDGEDSPIVRYVQTVITEALNRRASDIHMEPLEKRFRIRFRIDGVLHEIENPPKRLQPTLLSRIKLMANVSIAEKRIPQDGRIGIDVGDKSIDLRVSVLPTAFGESIVMRILDKEALNLGLPQLGFFSDDQANFERVISLPDGVFLVTGPTGSGKSTTLYSALNYINHPDRKIITVEDPIEYEMSGINQVGVKRDVGMTFSAALRSMLRQAPNIIMVGEIRDKETAEIAINASLTGHMVFSTLHTNDAPSAVSRLVDIGIKPFLVSASIRSVLAQRLVRKICPKCKENSTPDERLLNSLGIRPEQISNATFMAGKGCEECNNTGFRGRIGVFEMFNINEEIEHMIYEEVSLVALRKRSRELGMRTMREDGIRKVLAGVTTPEEVLKTTVSESI